MDAEKHGTEQKKIEKTKMKLRTIGLGIFTIAIASIAYWGYDFEPPDDQEQQNPGWYDHYLALKGDENGKIPRGLESKWMKEDAANKIRFKKTENNLLNIKEIGPVNVGGRTRSIVIDHSDPNHLVGSGVSGGVWTSNDNGASWGPANDFAATLAVTSITQSPFDKNLFYYGTGESAGNVDAVTGAGLFKSTDGAKSFEHLEHTNTSALNGIWEVEHSLTKDSTIYVATTGGGIWRSTDAGDSFSRIYATSARVYELSVFENGTIMAAINGLGIIKIDENDLTVTRLNGGDWPTSGYGRTSFDYCKDYPNVMYAQVTTSSRNALQGLYKTSNGGISWTKKTTPDVNYLYSWYCFKLSVAPGDSNFVLSLSSTNPQYTTDGGNTWKDMANPHSDYHEVTWYDDTKFLLGNDGGIHRMNKNFMSLYTSLNNGLNITQFYAGGYYPTGETIIGGTQDNGTQYSNKGAESFSRIMHSDGAFCAVNQQDETVRYVSTQNLNMYRQDASGSKRISGYIKNQVGGDEGVWFISPFEVNMLDGNQLYVPTRRATYRSTDKGLTWTALTADLLGDSYAVGLSNSDDPIAYIGGSSSRIYRVDNAATTESNQEVSLWTTKYPNFLGSMIGCIEVDPNDEGTIYCGLTNIRNKSRIWRVIDADTEEPIWEDIGQGLPESLPVNWIEVDPQMSTHIIVGTDFGLYTSVNNGASWNKEDRIPNVPVDQVRLRNSDRKLFIYTHGRGIWTADLADNIAVSIADKQLNEIGIYPNPTSDRIHISSKLDSVNLYNSLGEKLLDSSENEISVSHLKSGTYFVEILNGSNKRIQKIVITR